MNCRYVNKWEDMVCVDESFDSSEDSDKYSNPNKIDDYYNDYFQKPEEKKVI